MTNRKSNNGLLWQRSSPRNLHGRCRHSFTMDLHNKLNKFRSTNHRVRADSGRDWRHQYGIFRLKTQTSLSGGLKAAWCEAAVFAGYNLSSNLAWSIVSKAFRNSTKMAPVIRPLSMFLLIESVKNVTSWLSGMTPTKVTLLSGE